MKQLLFKAYPGEPKGFLLPSVLVLYSALFFYIRYVLEIPILRSLDELSQRKAFTLAIIVVTITCFVLITANIIDTVSNAIFDRLFVGFLQKNAHIRALRKERLLIPDLKKEARSELKKDRPNKAMAKVLIVSGFGMLAILPYMGYVGSRPFDFSLGDALIFLDREKINAASFKLLLSLIFILLCTAFCLAILIISASSWWRIRTSEGQDSFALLEKLRKLNVWSKVPIFVRNKFSSVFENINQLIWNYLRIYVKAYDVVDIFMRHYLRLEVPLHSSVLDLVNAKIEKILGKKPDEIQDEANAISSNDLYWVVYWSTIQSNAISNADLLLLRSKAVFARCQSLAL